MKRNLARKFKKNKYNLYLVVGLLLILFFLISFINGKISERDLNKYNKEFLIVKGDNNELKSYSLKDLRKISPTKLKVKTNKGLEEIEIEAIPLEKLLSNLNSNLDNKPNIEIEDSLGNTNTFPMSIALEVDRVYLAYKIGGKPCKDFDDSFGNFIIIDKTSDNFDQWIKDVKVLNIN